MNYEIDPKALEVIASIDEHLTIFKGTHDFMVWNKELSDAEIKNIEAFLADKYGIPIQQQGQRET